METRDRHVSLDIDLTPLLDLGIGLLAFTVPTGNRERASVGDRLTFTPILEKPSS